LSFTLQAVLSQNLLLHSSGLGRVLACELLLVTPAIRNLIREQKVEQIYLAMQTGSKSGMQTMNQSLCNLVRGGQLSKADAADNSTMPEEIIKMLQQIPDKK
jgi:twitching motility protein PilT